jgi:hypothetical protein
MLRADYLIGLAKSITAHGHFLFVGSDEVKLPAAAFHRNALAPLAGLRAVMSGWRQERPCALLLQIQIRLLGVGETESATRIIQINREAIHVVAAKQYVGVALRTV